MAHQVVYLDRLLLVLQRDGAEDLGIVSPVVGLPGELNQRGLYLLVNLFDRVRFDTRQVGVLDEGGEQRHELGLLRGRESLPMGADGGTRHLGEIEMALSNRAELSLAVGR